jgi:phage baseplate assembly protein W
MASVSSYQINLDGATWIDVNSLFTINGLPDRLPDELAVQNSLYNIFNCPIGARARTFQPEYGALWIQFLQEPFDQTTADKMQIALIQAIARWEPRITVDFANSYVVPDSSLPGYQVRISYALNISGKKASVQFAVQQ